MTTPPSQFEPGIFLPGGHNTDPPLPASAPTTGYKLNHSMLRIRDPTRSLHFYITLMGMRTVFTMNTGPFTIYYLGYPTTDAEKADLPAWAAKTAIPTTLTQTLGLLELYHIHGSEEPESDSSQAEGEGEGKGKVTGGYPLSTGNTPPNLGFGHLGFSVPDVPSAVDRLRGEGVTIVKELGRSERADIPLSEWEAERGVGLGEIHEGYRRFFEQIAYVADPDGYLVELVPQNMK